MLLPADVYMLVLHLSVFMTSMFLNVSHINSKPYNIEVPNNIWIHEFPWFTMQFLAFFKFSDDFQQLNDGGNLRVFVSIPFGKMK